MKPLEIKQKNKKRKTINTYRITGSDQVDIQVKGAQGKTRYALKYSFLSPHVIRHNKRHFTWMLLALLSMAMGAGLYWWRPQGLPTLIEPYFIELLASSLGIFTISLVLYWYHKTSYLIFTARYSHIPLITIRQEKRNPENLAFLKELIRCVDEASKNDNWHQGEVLAAELSGLRSLHENGNVINAQQYKVAKKKLLQGQSLIDEEKNRDKRRKIRLV